MTMDLFYVFDSNTVKLRHWEINWFEVYLVSLNSVLSQTVFQTIVYWNATILACTDREISLFLRNNLSEFM